MQLAGMCWEAPRPAASTPNTIRDSPTSTAGRTAADSAMPVALLYEFSKFSDLNLTDFITSEIYGYFRYASLMARKKRYASLYPDGASYPQLDVTS
jgi:hypothetical protein